jgi:hypothetical protein
MIRARACRARFQACVLFVSSCRSKSDRAVPFQTFLDRLGDPGHPSDRGCVGRWSGPACNWTGLIDIPADPASGPKSHAHVEMEVADVALEEPVNSVAESVARELQISHDLTPADLERIRRAFAFRNHPDRAVPTRKAQALLRMTEANVQIDAALKAARARRS